MRLFERTLFWKVYATLVGSLLLLVLIAATTWHLAVRPPMPPVLVIQDRAISGLMPVAGAPAAETQAALDRLARATGGPARLKGRDGRTLMAARPAAGSAGARPRLFGRRRIALDGGRTLELDEVARLGGGGPHILGMLLVVAALVGLVAAPVVAGLTRRLEALRASVDSWGAGQLSARARVRGGDEVSAVAASFNAAADRVEALLAAHQSLLAHASHELRSPLARLRMTAEVFAATGRADLLPAIHAEVAELDALVEEILLASRLDHAVEPPVFAPVDLLAVAAEEAARADVELAAVDAGSGPFVVDGSHRLLRRLIRNLIDNARKHGAPPVEVTLAHVGPAGDRRVRLTVGDRGPGIAEAERQRIFEPFYRPQGRPEAAGSWGLGLSLVRQIAERHGGRATCVGREGPGAVFIVDLPASPPD